MSLKIFNIVFIIFQVALLLHFVRNRPINNYERLVYFGIGSTFIAIILRFTELSLPFVVAAIISGALLIAGGILSWISSPLKNSLQFLKYSWAVLLGVKVVALTHVVPIYYGYANIFLLICAGGLLILGAYNYISHGRFW